MTDFAHEPVFSLTNGRGVPVCEAYLQRLNQTEFKLPAYCGRPEDARVPGFTRLVRVPVPVVTVNRLYTLVYTILTPWSISNVPAWRAMNANGGVFTGNPNSFSPANHFDERLPLSSWTYQSPIDINNDDRPRTVLMWNTDFEKHPACGELNGPVPTPARPGQFAFMMTSDGSTIDQRATIATFGHPEGGYSTRQWPVPSGLTFLKAFRPIGGSYGILEYKHVYYFDTFFDSAIVLGGPGNYRDQLDFEGKRRGDPALSATLGVFLHGAGHTAEVCEYHVAE